MNKELEIIKEEIKNICGQSGLIVKRIILFGSRTRGIFNKFSDYDILIILKDNIDIEKKMEISAEIGKKLADHHIDADLIIKSEEEFQQHKEEIGTVTREASKEGIVI